MKKLVTVIVLAMAVVFARGAVTDWGTAIGTHANNTISNLATFTPATQYSIAIVFNELSYFGNTLVRFYDASGDQVTSLATASAYNGTDGKFSTNNQHPSSLANGERDILIVTHDSGTYNFYLNGTQYAIVTADEVNGLRINSNVTDASIFYSTELAAGNETNFSSSDNAPEPTSGLLLLVGLAVLALRRKRG